MNLTHATYTPTDIPQYQRNPLIEALPAILSETEMRDALQMDIPYEESHRNYDPETRRHLLESIGYHFTVMPEHLQLGHALSKTIRSGYVHRNPLPASYWTEFAEKRSRLMERLNMGMTGQPTTGFSLIGPSGSGKTFGLLNHLSLYPQVIQHTNYNGTALAALQLTWLKIDCPHEGSVKGLIQKYFPAVDEKLGTSYSNLYGKSRVTVDQLMPAMTSVAAMHMMGCLIVDEIQHLDAAKTGGREKMLNFFVEMSNNMNIPIILVGTPKAMSVLTSEFRSARRTSGQGALIWERMRPDETWEYFVQGFWKYQYTRVPAPLTPELSKALYHETQGITGLAVVLYKLAQDAVIGFEEQITAELLSNVAAASFKTMRPFLNVLQTGSQSKYTDLSDLEDISWRDLLELRPGRGVEINSEPQEPEPLEEPKAPAKPKKKKRPKNNETGIVGIFENSKQKELSIQEELAGQGLMVNASELLTNEK